MSFVPDSVDDSEASEPLELGGDADFPPQRIAELAQSAYALRGPTVVDPDMLANESTEGHGGQSMQLVALHDASAVRWRIIDAHVIGNIEPHAARVRCVTADKEEVADLDGAALGFDFELPLTPWRLEIDVPGKATWVTSWQRPGR